MYRDQAEMDGELDKRTDYGNFEEYVKGKQDEFRTKYQEMATDPVAWQKVQPVIEHNFALKI